MAQIHRKSIDVLHHSQPACWSWAGLDWAGLDQDQTGPGEKGPVLNILDHFIVTSFRWASSTAPVLSMGGEHIVVHLVPLFLCDQCPTPRLFTHVYRCISFRVYMRVTWIARRTGACDGVI